MISLDRRTGKLIAVGATIAANCLPCLRTTVAEAGRDGITDEDIAEAVEIGKMVRHCAASPIDKLAASLSRAGAASSFQPAEDGKWRVRAARKTKVKGAFRIPVNLGI